MNNKHEDMNKKLIPIIMITLSRTKRVFGKLNCRGRLPVAIALAALAANAAGGQFTNGGFELPLLEADSVTLVAPGDASLPGWTITGPSVVTFINGFPRYSVGPVEGQQFIDFNGGDSQPGTRISQTFDTQPGCTYTVTFRVGRQGPGEGNMSVTATVESDDSNQLAAIQVAQATEGWGSKQSFAFTATTSTSILSFQDTSDATVSVDVTLDDVTVEPQLPYLTISAFPPTISWLTLTNSVYQVQCNTTLDSGSWTNWTNLGTAVPGDGAMHSVTDSDAAAIPCRFYRVVVH
jgi:hypothetical protein